MSTLTAPRPGTVAHVVRAAGPLLRHQATTWAWYWVILAGVAVVLVRVPTRFDVGTTGVWGLLDVAPRWFIFAMLLALLAGGLASFVAHGLTRRAVVAVLAVVGAATSLAGGVVWTLGAVVEAALTGRALPGAVVPLVLENAAQLAAYGAAGLLVGAVYYRAGAWWGTLTLPLTVGPTLLAEAWVATGWQGEVGAATGLPPAPPVLTYLLPVLVAVLLVAATRLVLARAAVRRPSS